FAARGLEVLWSACDAVVVVLGAQATRVRDALASDVERAAGKRGRHAPRGPAANRPAARVGGNRARARGTVGSVELGLRAARRVDPDALLVLPVDPPAVRPATVRALAGTMYEALGAFGARRASAGFAYALVPRYRRRRGHPLALSAALARAIVADAGATD